LHNERAEADIAIRLAGGTVQDAKHVILKAVKEVLGQVEGGERGVKGTIQRVGLLPLSILMQILDGLGGSVAVTYGVDVPILPITRKASNANCTVRGNILVVHGTTKDLTVGEPVEEQRGLSEIDSSGFSDGSIARSYHGLLGC
jgi:acetylornithine deacetylase